MKVFSFSPHFSATSSSFDFSFSLRSYFHSPIIIIFPFAAIFSLVPLAAVPHVLYVIRHACLTTPAARRHILSCAVIRLMYTLFAFVHKTTSTTFRVLLRFYSMRKRVRVWANEAAATKVLGIEKMDFKIHNVITVWRWISRRWRWWLREASEREREKKEKCHPHTTHWHYVLEPRACRVEKNIMKKMPEPKLSLSFSNNDVNDVVFKLCAVTLCLRTIASLI